MASNFFDSSALGKHYHLEIGSPKVEAILQEQGSQHFISRLGVVELISVFAGKVRTGVIGLPDFERMRRRFLTEVTMRVLQVTRMTGFYFQEAERFVRKHGPFRRLRTLDA